MPFLFDFKLNNDTLTGIEQGFTDSRKWEEALDEAKFSIPFYDSEVPFPQYGLIEILITEVDNFQDLNEIATETMYLLIISDRPKLSSQYDVYRHDITVEEYTGKLDAYIMASLAKTRSIESVLPAKFEVTDYGTDLNQYTPQSEIGVPLKGVFQANVWLPAFSVFQTYFVDKEYTFSQVIEAYQIIGDPYVGDNYVREYTRRPSIFRYYNYETETYSSWYTISGGDISITFPNKGKYFIEYGLNSSGMRNLDGTYYADGDYAIYRHYFRVIDDYQVTVYDLVESVRQNVSKAGGIESKEYFDDTRIFELDSTVETYLKTVSAPQMYLEQATARQMLIFALSYVNALPRLEYGSELDTLTIERFNLSTGSFEEKNIIEKSGHQNINQIGTRSYAILKQVLPNNMDEPTTYAPSQDGYIQVRATDLEITDATFSIQLPKPIYTPKELSYLMPKITISGYRATDPVTDEYDIENINIPITSRWINLEEWKLKYITDNFPSITTKEFWDTNLGLRENMVDNLYWQLGATQIKVSEVYGTLVNKTLVSNVIKIGLYEYIMLNMPEPITFEYSGTAVMYYEHNFEYYMDYLGDDLAYKDLKIRASYLSLEDLVVMNDKEDLSQIDFYSEMRQNQDEPIINVVRATRKNHGDLQRTGNKTYSFQKMHHSLSEQYEVGQKDTNGFTITTRVREWHPFLFNATYYITKHHNRESRQTRVDQTYRWKDNYARNVLDRKDRYSDYLIIYPPDFTARTAQTTKIYSNNITIRTILSILLGETITDFNTRASAVLIRTDGMFEVEEEGVDGYYGILTSVSAYPVKQGFAFTFGFDSNLVAGSGLVLRGAKYYNEAVRYTDEDGRFTEIGFNIFAGAELDDDDYETYPKITRDTLYDLQLLGTPYFRCGTLSVNEAGSDSLIVDKDPLTNWSGTYQLNMKAYYIGQYIIGQAFFSENFIVNNPNSQLETYLYLYENDMEYGMFEDLFIKDGYASATKLDSTKIAYNGRYNRVSFIGTIDLTDVTSWAIGDADGNLYIACNEGLNGFLLNKEHFLTSVREIGDKVIIQIPDSVAIEEEYMVEIKAVGHKFENYYSYEDTYEIEVEATGRKIVIEHLDYEEEYIIKVIATGRKVTMGHADYSEAYNMNIEATGTKVTIEHTDYESKYSVIVEATGRKYTSGDMDYKDNYSINVEATGSKVEIEHMDYESKYDIEIKATGRKYTLGQMEYKEDYNVSIETEGHKSVIVHEEFEETYSILVKATGRKYTLGQMDYEEDYKVNIEATGHKDTVKYIDYKSDYKVDIEVEGHKSVVIYNDFKEAYSVLVEATGRKYTLGLMDYKENYSVGLEATGHIEYVKHEDYKDDYDVSIEAIGHMEVVKHEDYSSAYSVGVEAVGRKVEVFNGDFEADYSIELEVTGSKESTIFTWLSSTASYWSFQDTSNRDSYTGSIGDLEATDYATGFAMRVTDGSFPIEYDYYKAGYS